MPGKNCVCCKCKDCRTVLAVEKNGGYWAPPPEVTCKGKQETRAVFVYQDSNDCGGFNCHRQQGCAVVKLCFNKVTTVRFRIWSQLEISAGGRHRAKIQYRKIGCASKCKKWRTAVTNASKNQGDPCCKGCVCDDKYCNFPRGKYEFRFTADSVDGIDHCNNYHVYDMKWCVKCKGKECIPKLPATPSVDPLCCSTVLNPCVPAPKGTPTCACPPGFTNIIADGWILANAGDISFV